MLNNEKQPSFLMSCKSYYVSMKIKEFSKKDLFSRSDDRFYEFAAPHAKA